MTIRKSLLPLLLALLLLAAQQAGWTHGLSHLGERYDSVSLAKQVPADKLCQQCLAFAQVGAALQRAPSNLVALPLENCILAMHPTRLVVVRLHCGFQSRAPPLRL